MGLFKKGMKKHYLRRYTIGGEYGRLVNGNVIRGPVTIVIIVDEDSKKYVCGSGFSFHTLEILGACTYLSGGSKILLWCHRHGWQSSCSVDCTQQSE